MNIDFSTCQYLIVGCGLSGAVIAERIATVLDKSVIIIEKRDHIGGNCYDYIDNETGIRVSKYGPHFFHTNDDGVWEYINKYSDWKRWDHKVSTSTDGKLVPLPVNINTINKLLNENLQTSDDMKEWVAQNKEEIPDIKNSEHICLSRFGRQIYEMLFKPYTIKQWDKSPAELDPQVLSRIPMRFNHDDRYFSDKYQVLPVNGYTAFIKNMLKSDNIQILLNTDYSQIKDKISENTILIFTGPIDTYFKTEGLPNLEYRSLNFQLERHYNMNYYQPFSVINYPDSSVPWTRITEYKHLLNQVSPHTIIVKETSSEFGEPYYPIPNPRNLELYEKYKTLADKEQNVHFLGRLANYKYFNMDQAIRNSLDFFNDNFTSSS